MNATMKENKTMTLRQRLERWDTERRLARRRRQRAMEPERPRRQPEQPLFQCLQGRPQKPFGPKGAEKGTARHIPP